MSFNNTPIELVEKYWDDRPCNIRHSTAAIGTKKYFDEVEERKYFVEPHIPDFAEFNRWKGKKVLEIGCGIGTDTINFARAGATVTAVDLSSKSLALATERSKIYNLFDQITFIKADVESLSKYVEPEPYDLVYSFGVLHHTPNPENAIREIKENFVTSGSTVKLMMYNRYSWKVIWILLTESKGRFWKITELIAKNSEAQTGCPVTYTYTPKSLRKLLGNTFETKNIFVNHIFPYRISEYVQYRYNKMWYFQLLPSVLFRLLERKLGWHLCITSQSR
ncbi:MAG TPA: class I SAM-dependent methyltransferase [Chloroflexi bacterium]|nr:class I SAM-dependent methyltransferase [Chloroflexota bacterium]|tara:strand:- start:33502 stop:34335 length:834 start_codon:yes stop_codon:yes gene_type:complete